MGIRKRITKIQLNRTSASTVVQEETAEKSFIRRLVEGECISSIEITLGMITYYTIDSGRKAIFAGNMNQQGDIYCLNENGRNMLIGRIANDGTVYNERYKRVGWISERGKMWVFRDEITDSLDAVSWIKTKKPDYEIPGLGDLIKSERRS